MIQFDLLLIHVSVSKVQSTKYKVQRHSENIIVFREQNNSYSKSKLSQNTTNLLSISCVLTELTLGILSENTSGWLQLN